MGADLLNFGLHLIFLGLLELADGLVGIDLHTGSIDLDLVRVHRRIRNHDLAVSNLLRASDDSLLQDETFIQERVLEASALLLNNLDVVQVSTALKPEHCVHRELSEVRLAAEWSYGGITGMFPHVQAAGKTRLRDRNRQVLKFRVCAFLYNMIMLMRGQSAASTFCECEMMSVDSYIGIVAEGKRLASRQAAE